MQDFQNVKGLEHFRAAPPTNHGGFPDLPETLFQKAIVTIQGWDGYEPTPCVDLADIARDCGLETVTYKHEGPRFGLGSFKALGGAYAVEFLNRQSPGQTYVSATDGNHGRSVAWGARRVGAPCKIYIHHEVSPYREAAIASYGADVIRVAGDYDDAVDACRNDAAENGWTIVSDTSWDGYNDTPKYVMAGYGVMIEELTVQLAAPPTHVFLQGGVGAFAAAMIAAMRYKWPRLRPRLISVEPRRAPCLFESAKAGRPVTAPVEIESIMAGLSCGAPSPLAWKILGAAMTDFVLIPDVIIPPTMRRLARAGVEGGESGVSGLAALLALCGHDRLREAAGLTGNSRVLLFGTEGITDPDIYRRIMTCEI